MSTQADFGALSRVLVSLPNWEYSVAASLALGAVAGVPLLADSVGSGLFDGVAYIGFPTVLTAALTHRLDAVVGGDLTTNRSAALALICEIVVLALWSLAGLAGVAIGPVAVVDIVVAALGFVVAIRALVLFTVSRVSIVTTAGLAVVQPVVAVAITAAAVFLSDRNMFAYLPVPKIFELSATHTHADVTVLVVLSVFYVLAAYVLLYTIDRPVRQSLEVTSLDFAHGMFRYLAGQPATLESFFKEFGQEMIVPVSVVAFRRRDSTEKARFVAPSVHPGPMGDIGGGRLPEKLAAATVGMCFPLHGMAGHDFNPVSQTSVDAVVDAATAALADATTSAMGTRSARVTVDDATFVGQRFGRAILAAATFAPNPADDIGYGVGLAAAHEVVNDGMMAVIADSHNSNDGNEDPGGFRRVTAGSPRAFSLHDAARRLGETLTRTESGPLRVGVAHNPTRWSAADGIGPLGVRVAVIESDDQRTAYILVDGNNADLGVRDRLRDAVLEQVDDAELLTTDNHAVTRTTSVNQVGQHIDPNELCEVAVSLVAAAIDDLESVVAASGTTTTTVQVFGDGRTERFASLANSMVIVGIALFCIALVVAVAFTVVLFLFF